MFLYLSSLILKKLTSPILPRITVQYYWCNNNNNNNNNRMEEGRSAFKIFTHKPTGKRPLGRPRRRWEDNIKMNLEEIGINAGNLVDSAQDRNYWKALVNSA